MNLEQANTAIRIAWKMSLISIGVTIALTFVYASGGSLAQVDWWNWVDIVLMLALTYGVYKKHRASAVTLFVYYVVGKIYIWIFSGAIIGLPVAAIFAYFFFRGIQGVFAYHRLIRDLAEDTAVHYSV
ncbi:MAG: hypothetical protein H6656_01305 [Ardenticatenaceae bacterium]|nr:hypothetical protein [Anaerolineales bacterium]MCB9006023.1 hypothetical protein [Ardenticatenaceae bacterium]